MQAIYIDHDNIVIEFILVNFVCPGNVKNVLADMHIGQNVADLWQKNIEIVRISFTATILNVILNIKNCSRVTPTIV